MYNQSILANMKNIINSQEKYYLELNVNRIYRKPSKNSNAKKILESKSAVSQ